MCFLCSLEVTWVSGTTLMTFAWRETHVACVFFSSTVLSHTLSLCNCIFGVLVEAHNWKHKNLVVQKSSEYQRNEPNDCLPMERFKSKQYRENPNEYSTRCVNSRSLSSWGIFGCCYSTHIETSNRAHNTKCEPDDSAVVSHLLECVGWVFQVAEIAKLI